MFVCLIDLHPIYSPPPQPLGQRANNSKLASDISCLRMDFRWGLQSLRSTSGLWWELYHMMDFLFGNLVCTQTGRTCLTGQTQGLMLSLDLNISASPVMTNPDTCVNADVPWGFGCPTNIYCTPALTIVWELFVKAHSILTQIFGGGRMGNSVRGPYWVAGLVLGL